MIFFNSYKTHFFVLIFFMQNNMNNDKNLLNSNRTNYHANLWFIVCLNIS